jgi:hypothetical protein
MSFTLDAKPPLPYAADKAAAKANLKAGNYTVTPADLKYDETAAAPGAEDRGIATAKAAANIQPSPPKTGFTRDPPPPAAAASPAEPSKLQPAVDVGGAFLRELLTLPDQAAHGALHFARAWSGGDTDAPDPKWLHAIDSLSHPTTQQSDTLSNIGTSIPGLGAGVDAAVHTPLPFGGGISASDVASIPDKMKNANTGFPMLDDILHHTAGALGAAGQVAPMAGGLAKGAMALDAATAAKAAEAASIPGKMGLRTMDPHPVAGAIAGPEALTAQNQGVAETVLGADAGVPHGLKVNAKNLMDYRDAPGKVLDDAAASIPTGTLSAGAQAKVSAARGAGVLTKPTPNVAAVMDSTEKSLLGDAENPAGPITGAEVRATRNSLNSDANAGRNSTDADTRAIAKYKQSIVDALDQHISDTLPPNSAVSPLMIRNARATLAKSYGLQDAIGPGGEVDLQALAKDHRDNPGKYSGNTRAVLQFASDHPEVTSGVSNASRAVPPSLVKDVLGAPLLQQPLGAVAKIFAGRQARSALTGPDGAAMATARQTPVAGLGGEFDHMPMASLHTPGEVGEPPSRQGTLLPDNLTVQPFPESPRPDLALTQPPGTVQGQPAQYQRPLSNPPDVGHPYQPPFGQGAPLRPVGTAPHQLDLAPTPFHGQPMSNADFARVLSEGVPDGGMMRYQASPAENNFPDLGRALVNRGGTDEGSMGGGASPEAAARPPTNLVHWNGDTAKVIARDSNQVDKVTPPHGSIAIDADTGNLVSSGTTPRNKVAGLLERWKAQQSQSGHIPLDQSF